MYIYVCVSVYPSDEYMRKTKKKKEDRKKVHPDAFFLLSNDGMGRWAATKVSTQKERKEEKGRKRNARLSVEKRGRDGGIRAAKRKKKKRKKNFTWGATQNNLHKNKSAYFTRTTKAHAQTHARISSSVCSFSFLFS